MKQKSLKMFLTMLVALVSTASYAYDAEINGIYYSFSGTNAAVTYGDPHYSDNITIPSCVEYNGATYSVTSIGESAFSDCKDLTSINIPNSVTSVGSYAFKGCSGLTNINIPNSVTSISSRAFSGCSGLTSIIVSEENAIYDSRNNCNAIIETATNKLLAGCVNTIIPGSVTSIGYYAFDGCSGLTNINIPNSVTSIGAYAFSGCSGLTSINIPNSVTLIGTDAFIYCIYSPQNNHKQ